MITSEGGGNRSRLGLRDLVLVALLAAVGGVLSTYVGYIGNLINRLFGVPFGAGQLIAGLHIVWPLLARSIIGRFGSGSLTGLTKGFVEFLSGGTHGVIIVIVSLVEGLLIDLGMGVSRRSSLGLTMVVGAVASASNVFVFQAIYFSGVSFGFVLLMAGLSLVSGATFGGYLTWDLRRLLASSRLIRSDEGKATKRRIPWRKHAATVLIVGAILAGGVYYYVAVYEPFADPGSARIAGLVKNPYTFAFGEWDGESTTVTAEMIGSVTYVPPAEYTGVLVYEILARTDPRPDATGLRVIADDGYEVRFDLDRVMDDEELLLILEGDRLRLVAAAYDGSHWVRRVTRLVVE